MLLLINLLCIIMENKPTNENENADENMNRDENDQEADQEIEKKIGFKNQKPEKTGAGDADENWKKVDAATWAARPLFTGASPARRTR